ncbi:MAG: PEP-CTERM sorting domain-containing protein [Deltaproteobacteria bacterium]|nr:PEP-CTERM sorting domain-containing protein [Deltaproteobacteria bacterium]
MRNFSRILVLLVFGVFLVAGNAMALSFENNITIYDGRSSGTGWYGAHEDNEVEPRCLTGQSWDLEAFFLDGSELTMVGGYDFIGGYSGTTAGDIFISLNSTGFYDYVLDMDYGAEKPKYDVYAIDSSTFLEKIDESPLNDLSNPFNYDAVDKTLPIWSGLIEYETGLTDDQVGLLGGLHNAVGVDLSFLKDAAFTVHATLSCGNDNLMGKTAPVPEPATMLLFGCGLVGMATVGRKKFRK